MVSSPVEQPATLSLLSSLSPLHDQNSHNFIHSLSLSVSLSLSQTLSLGSGFNDHDTFVPSAEEEDYSQNVKRRNKKAD